MGMGATSDLQKSVLAHERIKDSQMLIKNMLRGTDLNRKVFVVKLRSFDMGRAKRRLSFEFGITSYP
jgi:hypothetical protein